MSFNWSKQHRPYVILAPMAGYTDSPFRRLIKDVAPEVICMTELISADGMAYESRKTLEMLRFHDTERPHILQLFGKNIEHFREAVQIAEELGFDAVDINMGCPAKKVVNSMHGSALIKTPELAFQIVETCVKNTKLPVSVKTRLGWEDDSTLDDFVRGLEAAGAAMIMIHGRTVKQAFTGTSNWEPIYRVKGFLKVPVTGNGDILSGEDAKRLLGNLDGVMVGRGTFGNPWLMAEVCRALEVGDLAALQYKPQDFEVYKEWMLRHLRYSLDYFGSKKGMLDMRKTLAAYIRGFSNASEIRKKLVVAESFEEVQDILSKITL